VSRKESAEGEAKGGGGHGIVWRNRTDQSPMEKLMERENVFWKGKGEQKVTPLEQKDRMKRGVKVE